MPNCLAAAGPQNNTRASATFHTGYKRIESINARIRRAVNTRGHFPTEQAALKCVYLAITSLDPKGTGQKRWSNRWP